MLSYCVVSCDNIPYNIISYYIPYVIACHVVPFHSVPTAHNLKSFRGILSLAHMMCVCELNHGVQASKGQHIRSYLVLFSNNISAQVSPTCSMNFQDAPFLFVYSFVFRSSETKKNKKILSFSLFLCCESVGGPSPRQRWNRAGASLVNVKVIFCPSCLECEFYRHSTFSPSCHIFLPPDEQIRAFLPTQFPWRAQEAEPLVNIQKCKERKMRIKTATPLWGKRAHRDRAN